MVIKEKMKGVLVAEWQNFLKSNGFTIKVDGDFGKITTAITKEFQRENGLKADGIVGEKTWALAKKIGLEPAKPKENGINSEMLKKIFPFTKAEHRNRFIAPFNLYLQRYKIVSKLEIAAFLATGGIETDHLRTTVEYASGKDYEGRKDLGNTQTGDGMRFKGRGFFQTTGRFNYKRVTQSTFDRLSIDFEAEPIRLAEIEIAVESALIFWHDNDLSKWAKKKDFFGVSGKVNRGDASKKALHFDRRLALYEKCLNVLPEKIFL